MLKANALFIVIVISLVIGILCSSLIGIAYYQRLKVLDHQIVKRLEENSCSALNLLLGDKEGLFSERELVLDLFGENNDSVFIKKKSWGIFEIGTVKAFSQHREKIKSILIGYEPDSKARSAIYLVNQNSHLALSGNTVISGACYLPEQGVKRDYIEGTGYAGNELIQGEIFKSEIVLPELSKEIVKPLVEHFESSGTHGSEAITLEEKDTISASFFDPCIFINASSVGSLNKKTIEGNVVLFSDKLIVIDSSSRLQDIIVFAPSVVINHGFSGSLQIFCTDSIVVKDEVNLKYPSVLGLLKTNFKVMQPFIKVCEKSSVKGILFSYCHIQDLQKTRIEIQKDTKVEGQIYSDGEVDLKGVLYGNVTCSKFVLKTPSAIYENHLLNAIIDSRKLSPYFIGSSLIYSKSHKQVVKWLD